MYNVLVFVHVLSALMLGTYVVLPLLIGRLSAGAGAEQAGFVDLLRTFTRLGDYALIVLLLTGGGMISQLDPLPSKLWMSAAVGLILIIGAMIGIINKRLKLLSAAQQTGDSQVLHVARLRIASWIAAFAVAAAILIMTNPGLLA